MVVAVAVDRKGCRTSTRRRASPHAGVSLNPSSNPC